MNDQQALSLAQTLAKLLSDFIDKPNPMIKDINVLNDYIPKPLQQQQPLTITPELRAVINGCVHEVIKEMFKSGTLVEYNQQMVNNTLNHIKPQPNQAMIDYSQISAPPLTSMRSVQAPNQEQEVLQTTKLNPLEKKLLSVWNTLLQISEDSISGDENFFELGGDSILAMQMVGAARDVGLALTVANIFRHPTFAEMAAVIRLADEASSLPDEKKTSEHRDANKRLSTLLHNALYERFSLLEAANVSAFLQDNICPKIHMFRGGILDVFPATDFQALAVTGTLMEAKWMLNYFYLDGMGNLDLKRLKQSIFQVVNAFDILRTVFVPYHNRFFQVVLRRLIPSIIVEQCDNLDEYMTTLQRNDRENGPKLGESFLQFNIVKLRDSNHHRIIIRISHAQYDGVCFPQILESLQAGYKGQKIPETPPFSTFVRDGSRKATNDHYTYWKELLEDSSMTEIVRRQGPNYSRSTGTPKVLRRIISVASLASDNITPATVIKAAWSLVLAQISAQSDIVFGNVISGRNAAVLGVENIVGPCVNFIPVRVKFQSFWTVLDLLHHIQSQQISNMPYESLGFREIIQHCTDWPDWTNFSTVCQHQNIQQDKTLQLGQNNYTIGAVGSQEDFADLTVLSTPQEDGRIEICLLFTSDCGITPSFADKIFDELCTTATKFSTQPRADLPSPSQLSSFSRQTIDAPTLLQNPETVVRTQKLTENEKFVHSEVIARIWRLIIGDKFTASTILNLQSSFFALGGDIIGVAQVAALLESEGFKVRVEDLIDCPVMLEQVALLAELKRTEKEERERELMGANSMVEGGTKQEKSSGLKKLFGRSKKELARRMKGLGSKKDEIER